MTEYVAQLKVGVICPSCGCIMFHLESPTLVNCISRGCKIYGSKFRVTGLPTVHLEEEVNAGA